ncbi:TonB-dependent receptor [Gallaecimonas mangrovi]|uniref:TonB-dependent receptor n=1 Tax=Gallaecimonas mangrovi TaxID=2291597 RepID=UPI000E1FD9BB|nr:TonB-dependent receptor [Gallaecimonas mangrovi]
MFKPSMIALALASPNVLADTPTADTAASSNIEHIEVTGDFRRQALTELTDSVSVLSSTTLEERHTEALDQALTLVPNVNFDSGASRGRFIQIRGIGERSQYAAPIYPSVGLLVDGFDFSGMGLAGLISDVQQVEVYRGPQGTRFGANALGGLINIETRAPTDDVEGYAEASVANHNARRYQGAVGGGLSDAWSARLSGSSYKTDGDYFNSYQQRPTDGRDENTARLKLRYQKDHWQWDITGLWLNVQNGYDAFSFNNSRTTLSDQPGQDNQLSKGLGSKLQYSGWDKARLVLNTTTSHTDSLYSFDDDWSNPDYCQVNTCPYGDYVEAESYQRRRSTQVADLRLVSKPAGRLGNVDWVLGVYGHFEDEDLRYLDTYGSGSLLTSQITGQNKAVYGQLTIPLNDRWQVKTGARFEHWQADYDDSNPQHLNHSEGLWGGNVDLSYNLASSMYYLGLSRGYKPGGFNTDGNLEADKRSFDTETAVNLEAGGKWWLSPKLSMMLSVFNMWRDNMQVKTYETQSRGDGSSEFVEFYGNAASGRNYGAEFEASWQALDSLRFSGSLGLLRTRYNDFINASGESLDGRDQAQAPRWTYHLGADWQLAENWLLSVSSEGKDRYYFSDTSDVQAWSYVLWNANLAWQHGHWQLAVYGKNLFDRQYPTRGFGGWGNDPADGYAEHPYYQLGDGRVVGASATYRF